MQIKIGIIGTRAVTEKIIKMVQTFPTFDPVVRIVSHEEEAAACAVELSKEVEVILLSGPLAHWKVKEVLPASIPVHYVPLTGAGLFKALLHLVALGKLSGTLSVDTLTQTIAARTLRDLELEHIQVVVYNGPAYSSPEELIAFHREQSEKSDFAMALTGVERVAQQLTELQIPNEWMMPSDQDIIVSLERALLSTESRRGKELQIVVGIINVDDFGRLVMKWNSEHEVQKLKLDIHRMVLGYVESLDGYLTSTGGDEYLFFTTRGIFERETGGYKMIPLGKEANKSYGISLSIGIGFGISANEAGTHARAALRKSKEAGGNTCFIVREDRTLIGPLEMADSMEKVLPPVEAELMREAEAAGMTSAYLSRLITQMARYGKYEYTVHDLAALLEITVRSAHRLLLHWIDNGLVEISGMEKVPKGRPRQIFRFSFLVDRTL
ncbi:hypothetical protein KIH86_18210 [Paenibacillus sp. HN-1]|uniref:hypothetical protein n=1 Tax=Paenibacillus TaxID=44249 RepID=UPI001CA8257C|nr:MULTISPECIES: hypothetical protein [Paenibacillus]MBY9078195.1 hypothetical protein [Paenibacillus sp. CGMCC 1.18879]MBY9086146.1 hypothetical protein [Paenibacillus sinensis]